MSPHRPEHSSEPPSGHDVKVSVIVVTYNHERYIEQAIDSVLEQQATFPFELIITEDCSTDGTRDLVRAYAQRHPDRVQLLLSERNLNDNSVLTRALMAARGQYVALLDGDDWWTATDKLAKQVQILDDDRDASICFHNVHVAYESAEVPPHEYHLERPVHRFSAPRPSRYSGLEDLVRGNYIQTCSVMFRSAALPAIPSWYNDLPVGDWPLYVLLADYGRIVYLDEVLAAYRVHQHGLWSAGLSRHTNAEDILSLLRTYDVLDRHLAGRYHATVVRYSSYLHRAVAIALFRRGERRRAFAHWRAYGRSADFVASFRDRELWVNSIQSLFRHRGDGRPEQRGRRNRVARSGGPPDASNASVALTSERERP
jgi:glycosyltransferase involved in cell wall biosynthesis